MKTFNIIVPVQANYSYIIKADTLEEAIEMIGSGEADAHDMNVGDVYLDEAEASEVTPKGFIKL